MIRSTTTFGLLFGILSLTAAASAETAPKPSGISLGLRTGYAIPLGQLEEDYVYSSAPGGAATPSASLPAHVQGMIPVQLDAGYRINPNLLVGVFFQYGVGLVNKDRQEMCSRLNCSAHDVSFGAQTHYHFLPEASLDPWIGGGLGYEILGLTTSGLDSLDPRNPAESTAGYRGFFLTLQAGADFKLAQSFGLGPFVNAGIGHYNVSTWSAGDVAGSNDMNGGFHEWINLGVRGQFDL
jgi:hypothetical protein